MTIRKDLRDLKSITREVTMWAREIEAARPKPAPPPKRPPKPAPAPAPLVPYLPPEYSLVSCNDCESPAILIRDRNSFAAFCPQCRVITHLEAIEREPRK